VHPGIETSSRAVFREIIGNLPETDSWPQEARPRAFTIAYRQRVSSSRPYCAGSHPTLRPVNRNRDDRLGRRFHIASSPLNPTDWTPAAYGKNSKGSNLRRRAR
jgi:hypothetical protein